MRHQETKFKVGDKVRCDGGYSCDPCEGIIEEIDSLIRVRVTSSEGHYYNCRLFGYLEMDLRLTKNASILQILNNL